MTIAPFDYFETEDLSEAISTLSEFGDEAALLAGGTDLLNMIRMGSVSPKVVINLKPISELAGFQATETDLRLGALTKIKLLGDESSVSKQYPALTEAAKSLGSIQIRHVATLGGNLCRAAPCAETAPPLLVYGARIQVVGPHGERSLPVEEFFTGPGEVALSTGEILSEVQIPFPAKRTGAAYLRHSVRRLMDLALVNVAAMVVLDEEGKYFTDTRISLGSVAPTPIRVHKAEEALRGEEVSEAVIRKAAGIAAEESQPISDVRSTANYRRSITELLTRRALEAALSRIDGGYSTG